MCQKERRFLQTAEDGHRRTAMETNKATLSEVTVVHGLSQRHTMGFFFVGFFVLAFFFAVLALKSLSF